MTELLPCPFCGSKNITQKVSQRFPDFFTVIIGCADCPGSPLEIGKTKEEAEQKACKLWNTRHYLPEVMQAMERMKPLKPRYQYQDIRTRHGYCTCGNNVIEEHKNCHQCGQALDWEE